MKLTGEKALEQFQLMFAETERSEDGTREDQALLGAACRDLRVAHMVPRNAIAQKLGLDGMLLAGLERRCPTSMADQYRAAVLQLAKIYT